MVKVKEIRRWNYTDLMVMLDRYGWLGINGVPYDNAYCFVQNNKPTKLNIYAVANFIKRHCVDDERETVEHLMHLVFLNMVTTEFVVEKGE